MKRWLVVVGSVAALALSGHAPARAAENLTVCLDDETPPFSYKEGANSGGFDLAVAQELARHLGRPLNVQWFETSKRPEEDEPAPSRAIDALLSDGKCDLVGGVPLTTDLTAHDVEKSRLPDYDGAIKGERNRQVTLEPMATSRSYHFLPFTVLLAPQVPARQVRSLDDLQGLKIGSEDTTLADAIIMMHSHRRLMRMTIHVMPGKPIEHGGGLLDRLEKGEFDATLVEMNRFDAYRKDHPDTKIQTTGYYYSIGFNMGFVALAKNAELLHQVDQALADMLAKDELAPLAKAADMTYLPPRAPEVRGPVSLGDLLGNE